MSKKPKKETNYIRKQGNRDLVGNRKRFLTFCLSKHIVGAGQSETEWEKLGLLATLFIMLKRLGQHTIHEAKQEEIIKEYHKVSFPEHSEFEEPKHVQCERWAVMHITPKSKAVVAGYIEDDIFYIIFLDKDHKFWPMQNR